MTTTYWLLLLGIPYSITFTAITSLRRALKAVYCGSRFRHTWFRTSVENPMDKILLWDMNKGANEVQGSGKRTSSSQIKFLNACRVLGTYSGYRGEKSLALPACGPCEYWGSWVRVWVAAELAVKLTNSTTHWARSCFESSWEVSTLSP